MVKSSKSLDKPNMQDIITCTKICAQIGGQRYLFTNKIIDRNNLNLVILTLTDIWNLPAKNCLVGSRIIILIKYSTKNN